MNSIEISSELVSKKITEKKKQRTSIKKEEDIYKFYWQGGRRGLFFLCLRKPHTEYDTVCKRATRIIITSETALVGMSQRKCARDIGGKTWKNTRTETKNKSPKERLFCPWRAHGHRKLPASMLQKKQKTSRKTDVPNLPRSLSPDPQWHAQRGFRFRALVQILRCTLDLRSILRPVTDWAWNRIYFGFCTRLKLNICRCIAQSSYATRFAKQSFLILCNFYIFSYHVIEFCFYVTGGAAASMSLQV